MSTTTSGRGLPNPFCFQCRRGKACETHAAMDPDAPQPHPYCYGCNDGTPCSFHALPAQQQTLARVREGKLHRRRHVSSEPAPAARDPAEPSNTSWRGHTLSTYTHETRTCWLVEDFERLLEWQGPPLATLVTADPLFAVGHHYDVFDGQMIVYETGAYPLLESLETGLATSLLRHLVTEAVTRARPNADDDPLINPFAAVPKPRLVESIKDWKTDLRVTEEGKIMAVFTNLVEIFSHKPFWQDPAIHPDSPYRDTPGSRFAYNEMTDTPCMLIEPNHEGRSVRGQYELCSLLANHEEWFSWIRHVLGRAHHVDPDKYVLWDAVLYMARQRAFHPVREYLRSLRWDGLPRLNLLAHEILRIANPTPLQKRMLSLWMISCVARAFAPGCKVDTVLVLQGDQGLYKSTFFQVLGGSWFVDSPMDLENKDCFQLMAESWIYEWGEIGKLTRHRQAEVIKAFVTSREDTYRAPYERKPGRHPRSMVFVGTTNEDEFLVDRENRRFWVVPVTEPANLPLLKEWRDQLWAEAVAAYDEGPVDGLDPWVLRKHERLEHAESLESFRPQDPWFTAIRDYIDRNESKRSAGFTMREILEQGLGLETKEFDKARQMRASEVLRELGLRRCKAGKDRQWVWKRS